MTKKDKNEDDKDKPEKDKKKENTEFSKKFGDILKDANAIFSQRSVLAKISPRMDIGLGGGIPDGSFVALAGPPALGKTLLALTIAAEFQKDEYKRPNYPDRVVFYYNVENRIKERDLKGIKGLNLSPERFKIIESTEGSILHAEKFLQAAEYLILNNPGAIHLFDSFSALCTEAEITSDMDQMQRADGAKLLAKFCRKASQHVKVNNSVVIGINHIMGNPSGKGAETKAKGGYATAYAADINLLGKYFEFIRDPDNNPIGQIAYWQTVKTAIAGPGQMIQSYIRFGEGIDRGMELATLAVELGLIQQKGAWYSYGENFKWQGQEKMRNNILENPALFEELNSKVREIVGL